MKSKKIEKRKVKFSIYNFHLNTDVEIRYDQIDGTDYAILPVIMFMQGVHAGSQGPILYTDTQLSENYHAWNDTPICINHPQVDGVFVSLNNPELHNTEVVGRIFNTSYENSKLKAEAWLNVSKASEIIDMYKRGDELQVSPGLFSNDIIASGEFNGENYHAVATSIKPDHLAILPNDQGACSWNDGCGIRANKGEQMDKKEERQNLILFADLVKPDFKVNEIAYDDALRIMRQEMDKMDVQGEKYHYLRRMFDNHAVYECSYTGGGEKLYKRNYNINDNNEVQWTSDPQEVVERVSYDPVTNSNKKGEDEMSKKKECCLEEVKAFVAEETNLYTDNDVEWMSKLEEGQFKAIVTAHKKVEEEVASAKKESADMKANTPKAQTFEQLLANASPELQESVQHGQKMFINRKNILVEGIKANENNKFSDEQLNAFDIDTLENMASLMGGKKEPVTNFGLGLGESNVTTNKTEEHVQEPIGDPEAYMDKE